VDQSPFAAAPHPDGDRFHHCPTFGRTIPWLDIQVQATKAPRTVVPVLGTTAVQSDEFVTIGAAERAALLGSKARLESMFLFLQVFSRASQARG